MDGIVFLAVPFVGALIAVGVHYWQDKRSGLHCYFRGHQWRDHDGDIRALSCDRCGGSHINAGYG